MPWNEKQMLSIKNGRLRCPPGCDEESPLSKFTERKFAEVKKDRPSLTYPTLT